MSTRDRFFINTLAVNVESEFEDHLTDGAVEKYVEHYDAGALYSSIGNGVDDEPA
jgi:hypothetical protein